MLKETDIVLIQKKIYSNITPLTRAITPVHLFGHPCVVIVILISTSLFSLTSIP
jgi:dTDP-4-amino-4,6-dideoxygalactose transaminase